MSWQSPVDSREELPSDMHCLEGTAGLVRGMDYARKQAVEQCSEDHI